MTNQIHLPISEMQKLASLAIFTDPKSPVPSMYGVTIRVSNETITALATDRYALARYEVKAPGLEMPLDADHLWLSPVTCKALLAIKRGRHDLDACLVTYGEGVFAVEYQGITYKADQLSLLRERFEQMISYFDKPLEDSFAGFNLNPSHLAKLIKISKNNWRFDRFASGTTNQKLAPVLASCDGFNVIIQPTLTK